MHSVKRQAGGFTSTSHGEIEQTSSTAMDVVAAATTTSSSLSAQSEQPNTYALRVRLQRTAGGTVMVHFNRKPKQSKLESLIST